MTYASDTGTGLIQEISNEPVNTCNWWGKQIHVIFRGSYTRSGEVASQGAAFTVIRTKP